MATTTTTWTSMILTEIIGEIALSAPTPKNVVSKLANYNSIQGMPSGTLQLARNADLGAAATVAEGAAVPVTDLAMVAPATFTPADFAMMAKITYKAMRERVPGLASVHQLFDGSATIEQQLSVFMPQAARLKGAIDEAVETECNLALAGLTDIVNLTGNPFSVVGAEEAIFKQAQNEILNEDLAFCLSPKQLSDLRSDITTAAGPVWSTDIQSITQVRPDLSMDGLRGVFMGIPVYEISQSCVRNDGTDDFGALIVVGRGNAEGPNPGTLVVVEGSSLYFTFETVNAERSVELQCNYEFDAGLRAADYGVEIQSVD
tara:strand:- start:711 stop:1661 length:951 start_codon:yes stop_codon:yes gene_type:complete